MLNRSSRRFGHVGNSADVIVKVFDGTRENLDVAVDYGCIRVLRAINASISDISRGARLIRSSPFSVMT
jgi:hypothetical protein